VSRPFISIVRGSAAFAKFLALPKFAAAVARVKAQTGYAVFAMVGDSVTRGYGAGLASGPGTGSANLSGNFLVSNSWPHQLAALWSAAGIPARSDAFFGSGNPTTANQQPADVTAANPNVTFGSGWAVGGSGTTNYHLGGTVFYNSTTTSSMSFAPEIAANQFDIYYDQRPGDTTFTVSDASGTLATINPSGTAAFMKATVNRSISSTSPISIQKTSASGAILIVGIVPRDTTAPRLEIWNLGAPGWKTGDWQVASAPYSPFPALATLSPDLFSIQLGANDANQGVTATQFQINEQALVNQLKSTGADVVQIKTHRGSGHTQTATDLPDAFLTAIDAVNSASALSLPAINLNTGISLVPADYFDAIHLTQQGYAKEAAYAFPIFKAGIGI
jgi:hypothetical protein